MDKVFKDFVFLNGEYITRFVLFDAVLNNYWSLPLSVLKTKFWAFLKVTFKSTAALIVLLWRT